MAQFLVCTMVFACRVGFGRAKVYAVDIFAKPEGWRNVLSADHGRKTAAGRGLVRLDWQLRPFS